jgi:outer membrane protein assembly factor BamD
MTHVVRFRLMAALGAAVLAVGLASCGSKKDAVPAGVGEPDKFLFERGTASLEDKKWVTAREYFRRILDGYPQSELRPDSKLGIGDSYLGEGTAESLVLAASEFREFLTFYPTNTRADYAQYKLGMVYFKQMRGPQRDQTETREAVKELQTFMERYPNSSLRPEVEQKLREARDRVSQSEYQVGVFYFKQKWYPGAIDRLRALLKSDPQFTYRDGAYYYLGEALLKVNLNAEALPLYEKLIAEFSESEYLEKGKLRLEELKTAMTKAGAPPPAETPASETAAPSTTSPSPTPAPAPAPAPQPPPQPKPQTQK